MTDEPDHPALAPRQDSSAARGGARRFRLVVAGAAAAALLTVGGLVVARDGGPELPGGAAAPSAASNPANPANPSNGSNPSSSSSEDAVRAATARDRERRDAVTELLERRASALLRRDRGAFLATVGAGSPAFRTRQATWFDNLADVPLADWDHRLGDPGEVTLRPERLRTLGSDAFAAPVEVGYRLDGHDRVPQRFEQTLTFGRRDGRRDGQRDGRRDGQRDGRWLVVGDSDAAAAATEATSGADGAGVSAGGGGAGSAGGRAGQRQLWDFGPVRAVSTRYGLVLGLGSRDTLRSYAREVDRAVPRVVAFWRSQWSRRVVVVVPRTEEQMAALLGGRPGRYTQLAAITRGELGTTEDAAPADRVYINPKAFGRLSPVGRQVIMTHEITHVASRAQTQSWTPKWLSEGFADYVGYRDSGLSTGVVAQELAADVRRGRLPSVLPGNDAFLTTRKNLPQVYEQSWLACRLMAERYGRNALIRFYRAVGDATAADATASDAKAADATAADATAVERAFREELGTTQARFTREWRAYIARQLR